MSAPPPPPPPAFNLASATSTSPDQGRNLLLQSIRGGKTLRKTVTNDKSAPCISGTVKNGSINSNNSLSSPPSPRNANNTNTNSSGPMSLGGLFAGGMPKLKPTGLRGLKTVDKDSSCPSSPSTLNLSPNNFNNNNNNSNSNNNNNNNSSNNNNNNSATIKRGPPPVPPPAAQKPQVPSQNINELNSQEPITKGFGKPMLAPKPPAPLSPGSQQQKPCPPPKKLDLIRGGSVSRAQSMRVPRSPPVLAPSPASIHQSQDCLNETQHRPINRILKPPVVRPPSPPISRPVVVAAATTSPSITRSAPPPPTTTRIAAAPPTMPPPPPPPPHRSSIGHQRLAPPPPPTRNLSLSNEQQTTINLEQRFIDLFHSIATFPNPEPFRGVPKLYSSKNAAKQQAPAPPQQSSTSSGSMIQLNTSSGVKQWQHNAASSTC